MSFSFLVCALVAVKHDFLPFSDEQNVPPWRLVCLKVSSPHLHTRLVTRLVQNSKMDVTSLQRCKAVAPLPSRGRTGALSLCPFPFCPLAHTCHGDGWYGGMFALGAGPPSGKQPCSPGKLS